MKIKKNLIQTLVLGIFVFTIIFIPNNNAKAKAEYREGALLKIKGSQGAAVYKIGDDGKKYVYPDQKTFNTWYDDFSEIKEVELEELDDIDDGGTVPVQAGTKLITHPNTAKVYAVGEEGELTYIPDESTAVKFYGNKWTDLVTDVDPGLFSVSYKVKKEPLADNNIPDGSLVEEEATGQVFIIEDGQRKKVEEEALRLRNLIKKYTIRLNELSDMYDIGNEYEYKKVDIFQPSGKITFEDISEKLPDYNKFTQHALTSFNGISWDNDGKSGGTGWGVYSTKNSQPNSGSNYVLNRHGINFLGFTFPEVVKFKGAYFAKAVSNDWMDIDYPEGHSAVKLRYLFYDENLNLISKSDWFDLTAIPRLFPADINVKRVVIEHDTLNTTVAGFNTQDAEWFSMDDIIYEKRDSSVSQNPLSRAYILYRDQLTCGTNEPVSVDQVIKLRDESGRVLYGNFRCVNRYQQQCIDDGSFDTYYKEYCTDANGNIIDIGEDASKVLGTKEYSDGTLLRGSDNKIYVLENGKKLHISTFERLLRYIGQEIINVSDEILDLY